MVVRDSWSTFRDASDRQSRMSGIESAQDSLELARPSTAVRFDTEPPGT